MSKVTSKWYGETGKYVGAVFSLAQKLAPTILFISLWDGLEARNGVIVLGATNRPYDVDPAILRRLPRQFKFPMPNLQARANILVKTLRGVGVMPNVNINEL